MSEIIHHKIDEKVLVKISGEDLRKLVASLVLKDYLDPESTEYRQIELARVNKFFREHKVSV